MGSCDYQCLLAGICSVSGVKVKNVEHSKPRHLHFNERHDAFSIPKWKQLVVEQRSYNDKMLNRLFEASGKGSYIFRVPVVDFNSSESASTLSDRLNLNLTLLLWNLSLDDISRIARFSPQKRSLIYSSKASIQAFIQSNLFVIDAFTTQILLLNAYVKMERLNFTLNGPKLKFIRAVKHIFYSMIGNKVSRSKDVVHTDSHNSNDPDAIVQRGQEQVLSQYGQFREFVECFIYASPFSGIFHRVMTSFSIQEHLTDGVLLVIESLALLVFHSLAEAKQNISEVEVYVSAVLHSFLGLKVALEAFADIQGMHHTKKLKSGSSIFLTQGSVSGHRVQNLLLALEDGILKITQSYGDVIPSFAFSPAHSAILQAKLKKI